MAAKRNTQAGNRNKTKATTQPVRDISELVGHWARGIDLENGYQGLSVEVIGRKDNVLSFYILDSRGKAQRKAGSKAFTINLDDGMEAWSSLPSTAQGVDPESSQRIGYLFVTPQWLARNRGDLTVMVGPKWPSSISI